MMKILKMIGTLYIKQKSILKNKEHIKILMMNELLLKFDLLVLEIIISKRKCEKA